MKTTASSGNGSVRTLGNITFDSRRYTEEGLANLYSQCNAFVLPTAGEGWGLTLLEALVSGLPIVTTRYGGQMDFLDDRSAFFADHTMQEVITTEGSKFNAAIADHGDVAKKMLQVLEEYPRAVNMAELGNNNARESFTWEKSSRAVVKLIRERL